MSVELNNEFKKNPLAFFKKYPVVPPSDLGQKLQNLSVLFDEKAIGKDISETDTKVVKSAWADPEDLIRYIDFKVTASRNEPGALTFSGTKVKTPDSVPIYFLPWRSLHLVKMKIPELSARDYDRMEIQPNIFFTAAINGCSVFVKGGPTSPEVSHAGIDGKLARDAAQFWRDCLAKAGGAKGITGEVNKAHYTKDTSFVGPARTPLAADYMRWLQDEHRQRFTISEVSPWGCVFGIRFGRLWSFYLQENATVTTLEFIKKKHVSNPSADWPVTKVGALLVVKEQQKKSFMGVSYNSTVYAAKRTATRPMRISDFYPGGPGRYSSKPLFTKIV
jgi:hypothetical protein